MTKTAPAKTTKSDLTRAAILNAASRLFAELGYERTTIRDVAARAGIDPAMVIRYFGGKDELFASAVAVDLRLPDLAGVEPERIGETLVRHFLGLWESENRHRGLPLLLRSAASNDYAAGKMREVFMRQVLPALSRSGDPATAGERAGLVASQLLGMALCRYVLKLPPVVAMSREHVVETVGATVQRYIMGEAWTHGAGLSISHPTGQPKRHT